MRRAVLFPLWLAILLAAPAHAARVTGTYRTDSAQSVDAHGSRVYVAEGYRGLTVLDVSRPEHPAVVSTCDSVYAMGVAVKGDYALVADSAGLRAVQILVPSWLAQQ